MRNDAASRSDATWPEVLGLTYTLDDRRYVCVGTRGSSLVFVDGSRNVVEIPSRSVVPDVCTHNAAILCQALLAVINAKPGIECRYDRAVVVPQVTQLGGQPVRLFLYEAGYREALYPQRPAPAPHLRAGRDRLEALQRKEQKAP